MLRSIIDIEDIRIEANHAIDKALKDVWLDPETVSDYKRVRDRLQKHPFRLQSLAESIRHEIATRKEKYGY